MVGRSGGIKGPKLVLALAYHACGSPSPRSS